MSGRLHVFLPPVTEQKLLDLMRQVDVMGKDLAESHVMQMSLEYVFERQKAGFTDPEKAEVADVPDPLNTDMRWLYLKQSNVNRAFALAKQFEIDHHDFVIGHLVQCGIRWLHELLNMTPQQLHDAPNGAELQVLMLNQHTKLQTIIPPKVVYHN